MSSNKKISSFLNEALASQIIDENIKEKLEKFAEKYEHKSILSFLNIIGFCGAIAIILGSILLISHNWYKIPNIVKFSSYISSIIGLYVSAFLLQNNYEKISQIIYFIIAGLMIAGIGLIAQIFHLTSENGEAFLSLFLLTIPLALVIKNSWIATLSALSFYVWIFINAGLGHLGNSVNQIIFFTIIFSSGILLPKTFKNLNQYFHQIKFIGYVSLGSMIYLLGILKKYDNFENLINLHQITIAILIFNLICIAINFKNNYREKTNIFEIFQQSESVILVIILAQFLKLDHQIFYWAIWFWSSIIMIYRGEFSKNRGLINAGIWFFTLGLITRFIDLIKSMLFTGSMFIIFGILLIAIAVIAEKFRKKFINNIFSKHE